MFSSSISDGDSAVATQYNNLRLDIFDQTGGHDHDGTSSGGKKVGHGNLTDGAIPNTYLTHSVLSNHVQGSGTSSSPDDDGGDRGVHGLDAVARVAGGLNSQWVIDAGVTAGGAGSGTVYFTTPFSAAPYVVVCLQRTTGGTNELAHVYNRTTTSFSFCGGNDPYLWIAVGTK